MKNKVTSIDVKEFYISKPEKIPVLGHWDVIVCGGGAAGCAAAVTAAQQGADTLIVERDGYLGGATVNQLMPHILSTNGVDFQGIWHNWIRAIRNRKQDAVAPMKGKAGNYMYRCGVDPEVVKYAWEDMLDSAGCNILFHSWISRAIVEDKSIKGIVIETKSGSFALYSHRVIDCTGDGLVCALAGADWEQGNGEDKWNQSLTKVFRMGNVKWPEDDYSQEEIENYYKQVAESVENGFYDSPIVANGRAVGYAVAKDIHVHTMAPYRTEMSLVPSRVLKVNPLDPLELSDAEREGRKQAWQAAEFIMSHLRGYEDAYLLDTSAHIGVRDSRRIKGIDTVSNNDTHTFRKRTDSIARSSWDIDIWPGDSYDKPAVPRDNREYQKRMEILAEKGEFFDIPYGCIVVAGIENLLVGGRCISAEREAEASLRIQQTCQATGEAAGMSAAISISSNTPPDQLSAAGVVKELTKIRQVGPAFECLKDIPIA